MVVECLLSAVMRSSSPEIDMSFFISYDAHDVLRQATESTLRYQKRRLKVVAKPCKKDAFCVNRLRSRDAILVGKTNVHELNAGTSRINPHYGSARIPAALCGVVGFPSFGRIPHSSVLPLNWTVVMVGVLVDTVEDSLIVYATINDEANLHQPTTVPAFILYNSNHFRHTILLR